MIESFPMLSIVPPLLAIVLVIATKKVLASLGAGVLASALLVTDFAPLATLGLLWETFSSIFWNAEEGAVEQYYVLILVFLLTLGVITSLVMMAGGTSAFAEWTMKHIRTRRGAQFLAATLGVIIFIDDYFNALAVGQVARPLTDRHKVSRAKLAYLIDSTSAPVAVLAPFSSWGASIIGIIAPILVASTLTISDVGAFLVSASMNYYAIGAVVFLFFIVAWDIDFGPMRREERRAIQHDRVFDPGIEVPGQLTDDLPRHEPGAKRALIVPFLVLVVGVVSGMLFTGWMSEGGSDAMAWLAATDVPVALNIGGLAGLATALYYYLRYTSKNPDFSLGVFWKGFIGGARSMLPAIYILLLAWMLGSLIGELGTGEYLGGIVASSSLPTHWLVPMLFLVAAGMAFATGTSWGSFGILLPIAGDILNAVPDGDAVLLAAFGAVLAGAVFGDHCSPISDTTILSSTGASCNLIVHVNTQLPYALVGAGAAVVGYVVYATLGNGVAGLVATLAMLVAFSLGARMRWPSLAEEQLEARAAKAQSAPEVTE